MNNHIRSRQFWLIVLVISALLMSAVAVTVMAQDDEHDDEHAAETVEHDAEHDDEHAADHDAEHDDEHDDEHDADHDADHGDDGHVADGRALFVELGCVACHGENAEGTEIAPPLAGLTDERIRQQVRAPINIMPVFGPDVLSNAELDQLVTYLTGLPTEDLEHSHDEHANAGPFRQQEKIIRRYWLALFSLAEGDIDEAIFNIEQIDAVVIAQHKAKTQQILLDLSDGNLPGARAAIQEALAGLPVTDESSDDLRIQLARFALLEEDADAATHDLQQLTGMDDVIGLIEAGDFAAAQEAFDEALVSLGASLGGDAEHVHGVDDDHGDGDDHDGEHDDEHSDDGEHEHSDEHSDD